MQTRDLYNQFQRLSFVEQQSLLRELGELSQTHDSTSDYQEILERENFMRDNFYNPEYEQHQMRVDPHFGLMKITEEVWDNLIIPSLDNPNLIGYDLAKQSNSRTFKTNWKNIQDQLTRLYAKAPKGTIIAGGALFGILFEQRFDDVDFFFVDNISEEEAIESIKDYIETIDFTYKVTRTKGTVTVYHYSEHPKQIILRLYNTISEIITGFDVDSCGIGYDGELWMTRRCYYALTNGYNTFNPKLGSPSYLVRLMKYANRGIPLYLEGFDRERVINQGLLQEYASSKKLYLNASNLIRLTMKEIFKELPEEFKEILKYPNRLRMFRSRSHNGIINQWKYGPGFRGYLCEGLLRFDETIIQEYLKHREIYNYLVENNLYSKLRNIYEDEDILLALLKESNKETGLGKLLILEESLKTSEFSHNLIKRISSEESDYEPNPSKGVIKLPSDMYTLKRISAFSDLKRAGIKWNGKNIFKIQIGYGRQYRKDISKFFDMSEFYQVLSEKFNLDVPKKVEFKTSKPNEQMTCTLNSEEFDMDKFMNTQFYDL